MILFRIDRIIHSDLIRARQTTAAVLAGLQTDVDGLFDSPDYVGIVNPQIYPNHDVVDPKNSSLGLIKVQATPSDIDGTWIGKPYKPFESSQFSCQLSRLLNEGPPPAEPDPPCKKM